MFIRVLVAAALVAAMGSSADAQRRRPVRNLLRAMVPTRVVQVTPRQTVQYSQPVQSRTVQYSQQPVQSQSQPVQQSSGLPILSIRGGDTVAQQKAIASARYRAARGIKGHSHLDAAGGDVTKTGVGWSYNRGTQPSTCYMGYCDSPNAGYASVRAADGSVYSTTIVR